ncbi:hypothetical protein [Synechococcus elongatus]|uniref:Uncharacterized protein n=1 Tax=Synechococcus elongatus PCC 11802 TaxID=2283154 RepID=A0AAT9JUC3_SYNEL|nr:hypothetical protein [Synechococcus elongatus]QFZ92566.1 hypothetical protein EKO22_09630 [Synechococcus elongatus PCC 11802]
MSLKHKTTTGEFYRLRSPLNRHASASILLQGVWGSRVPQCVGVGVRNHPHEQQVLMLSPMS